jgi:hypothetical protein
MRSAWIGLLGAGLAALVGAAARAEDAPGLVWPEADGTLRLAAPYAGSRIVLRVSRRMAGAIDSLTWAGREFVNDHDHGREWQSAAFLDDADQCDNPTEAGGDYDGEGEASTSRLLALRRGPNWLETRSRLAYWLAPGQAFEGCPGGLKAASRLSDTGFAKRVTLGLPGLPNAIRYEATFTIARARGPSTFETLTGYMPPDFTRFYTYDPKARRLTPLSDGPGEQASPVIFATADGRHAAGVWSPTLPQADFPEAGYGRFRFDRLPGPGNATVKWNCVHRLRAVAPGPHRFTCVAVVGSLAAVQAGLTRLSAGPPAARGGRP